MEKAIICYDGMAVVSGTTGLLISYTWEVSYDGGTWSELQDNGVSVLVNGGSTLSIYEVRKKNWIRRKATPLIGPPSYTTSVTVTPYAENIISFPNNTNSFAISLGSSFTLPNVTTSLPSTIEIFNSEGHEVSGTIAGLPEGIHTFIVKATTLASAGLAGCESQGVIQVLVYNLADCNSSIKRTFATKAIGWASGLSGVSSPNNATNNDRSQYATLTGGVVLLGIGTVGIDLYFLKPDETLYSAAELRGKKVTIKLGEEYSLLKLAGGLSVVGRKTNGGVTANDITSTNATNVGTTFNVKGGMLDLLKGDNVFEYSFVPTNSNGETVEFNGVRIQLGSLLGVADIAKVFYAYIEESDAIDPNANPCTAESIQVSPPASLAYPSQQQGNSVSNSPITLNQFAYDSTWGNTTEVLNVATSLASVTYPYYAIDNNFDSYAIFNTTAGVLNKQFLNVILRQVARPGDQIQITLGTENSNVLSLGLLDLVGYRIKYYLGTTLVGVQTLDSFKLLDLGLLGINDEQKVVISTPITIPFDRIQLEQWQTVSVNLGNQVYIYDIRINPQMLFEGQDDSKGITKLCADDYLVIQLLDYCTSYDVSFGYVTQYGEALIDEEGNLLIDEQGEPIMSIKAVQDIANSALALSHYGPNTAFYEIEQLYNEHGDDLLVKVQTKRQGCNYGDPQYLRVKLTNCNSAIVNPIIKSGGQIN